MDEEGRAGQVKKGKGGQSDAGQGVDRNNMSRIGRKG